MPVRLNRSVRYSSSISQKYSLPREEVNFTIVSQSFEYECRWRCGIEQNIRYFTRNRQREIYYSEKQYVHCEGERRILSAGGRADAS